MWHKPALNSPFNNSNFCIYSQQLNCNCPLVAIIYSGIIKGYTSSDRKQQVQVTAVGSKIVLINAFMNDILECQQMRTSRLEEYLWLCDEIFWREPPFRLLPATVLDCTEGGVPAVECENCPLLSFLDLCLRCWLEEELDVFWVGRKAGGLSSPDSCVSLNKACKI